MLCLFLHSKHDTYFRTTTASKHTNIVTCCTYSRDTTSHACATNARVPIVCMKPARANCRWNVLVSTCLDQSRWQQPGSHAGCTQPRPSYTTKREHRGHMMIGMS